MEILESLLVSNKDGNCNGDYHDRGLPEQDTYAQEFLSTIMNQAIEHTPKFKSKLRSGAYIADEI
jgi:hypothetical protein